MRSGKSQQLQCRCGHGGAPEELAIAAGEQTHETTCQTGLCEPVAALQIGALTVIERYEVADDGFDLLGLAGLGIHCAGSNCPIAVDDGGNAGVNRSNHRCVQFDSAKGGGNQMLIVFA